MRLKNAGQLFTHTDLPAREVVKAVGYTAAGHFAQLLRRTKGYAADRISKNSPQSLIFMETWLHFAEFNEEHDCKIH